MSTRFKTLMAGAVALVVAGVALGLMFTQQREAPPAQPPQAAEEKSPWLIGLSLHMTTDDYGVFMSKAFQQTLEAAKVDYIITDAQHQGEQQRQDIERHIARRVDALVIVPTDDQLITQETNKAAAPGHPHHRRHHDARLERHHHHPGPGSRQRLRRRDGSGCRSSAARAR